MSEERLQEIKDSISLQYKVQEANDLNNFNIFTDEEQELVDEIERLNNIINKAIEYIGNHFLYHYGSDKRPIVFEDNYIQEIVDILKGSEKE